MVQIPRRGKVVTLATRGIRSRDAIAFLFKVITREQDSSCPAPILVLSDAWWLGSCLSQHWPSGAVSGPSAGGLVGHCRSKPSAAFHMGGQGGSLHNLKDSDRSLSSRLPLTSTEVMAKIEKGKQSITVLRTAGVALCAQRFW